MFHVSEPFIDFLPLPIRDCTWKAGQLYQPQINYANMLTKQYMLLRYACAFESGEVTSDRIAG